jgi:hypothetical protein
MKVDSFLKLEDRLFPFLKQGRHGNLSRREQLAIGLSFFSSGSTVRQQADLFGRSESTVVKCRSLFVEAMLKSSAATIMSYDHWILKNCTGFELPFRDSHYEAFRGCIGAIDGTHFAMKVPSEDSDRYRNRKGYTSTNVLIGCDFEERICFVSAGCEGSAHDGFVLDHSTFLTELLGRLPSACFFLGDAGYPLITGRILTPFRGVRYHLKEYSSNSPTNPMELFNLRHSTLRSIVERCIGRVKRRWAIFKGQSELAPKLFCKAIVVACLLHNFLEECRDRYSEDETDSDFDQRGMLNANLDYPDASTWRTEIAQVMWDEYRRNEE